MYQRQQVVLDAEHTPGTFAELCRRYGISRKTDYKWLERNARLGPESLADRSHRPQPCPHATAPALIREILQLRKSTARGARPSQSIHLELASVIREDRLTLGPNLLITCGDVFAQPLVRI
jgi:transposase-like protein